MKGDNKVDEKGREGSTKGGREAKGRGMKD